MEAVFEQYPIDAAKHVTDRDFKATPVPRRPGDPVILVESSAKARKVLGWEPQFADIDTIADHAWKWQQILNTLKGDRKA